MMVYSGADRFKDYKFSLEASFTNLQYESYEQIQTISIFGLIAQMGGQLGLFAGMSLLTLTQITIYFTNWGILYARDKFKSIQLKRKEEDAPAYAEVYAVRQGEAQTTDFRSVFSYEWRTSEAVFDPY